MIDKAKLMEKYRREVNVDEYKEIRDLYIIHSKAEDNRDIAGLLSTLTEDCVYEMVQEGKQWQGHAGAAEFYAGLLSAFPDIHFDLTDIVIGPQGVCEEAQVTGTHLGQWLGEEPTNAPVNFKVIIFFPWDREKRLFKGEKIYFFP